MKYKLNNGFEMIIDEEDLPLANRYTWYALRPSVNRQKHYVVASIRVCKNKQTKISFSRELLKIKDNKIYVDHINGNTLDNRKSNLRTCTPSQNSRNRVSSKGSSSKYLGVGWSKLHKKWRAKFMLNDKEKHIGLYVNEEDAAKAYDKKVIEFYGEFANPNFKNIQCLKLN